MDSFILASSESMSLRRIADAWGKLGTALLDQDDPNKPRVTLQSPSGSRVYLETFQIGTGGDLVEDHNELFALLESPHFYCMDYNDRSFALSALQLLTPLEPTLVVEDDVSNTTDRLDRFLSKVHS
jgi:hypothetical protein